MMQKMPIHRLSPAPFSLREKCALELNVIIHVLEIRKETQP